MDFKDCLTEILLSDGVVERFLHEYEENAPFHAYIDGLLPEVALCYKQSQRTVWHVYNVLEHILHSVEEMNALTRGMEQRERVMLAYIMFFHDLGKPAYHTQRTVDGVVCDSFKFHNVGSAQIARRTLEKLGFDGAERAVMERLVYEHDVFLKVSETPASWQILPTREWVREMISSFDCFGDGKRVFLYLTMIGTADNRAQNPAMTQAPLKTIAKIRAMAEEF